MSEPLVIIGKGMAATRLCEELSKVALGRYSIAVIGEEPHRAYNRVLLSSLLAGDVAAGEIELKSADWWRGQGVTTLYGRRVVAVDTGARRLTLDDGLTLPFAKLVFATGSEPVRLPLPGGDLAGVMTFRTLEDVARMRAAAGRRAVVIGGGLLGLEAASGLARSGASVTLIHVMDRLMERQLDDRAAAMLATEMAARGIRVVLKATTEAILGDGHVTGVRLGDGRELAADLVVMAVGIKPNAALARAAGIDCNRGIIVDDGLETNIPGIHAIGECAEHRGIAYGLVEPAYEQARILAERLAGGHATYRGSLMATNLKVSGVALFSAGDFLGSPDTEAQTLSDAGLKTYKKLVFTRHADGRSVLSGCVLSGDTGDGLWYLDLIRSGTPVDAFRDSMIFGRPDVGRQAA